MATPVKPDKGETSMPLDLASKLAEVKKPKPTSIETWIGTLDADDQAALEAARYDAEITTVALYNILTDAGARVSEKSIAKWRRGQPQ